MKTKRLSSILVLVLGGICLGAQPLAKHVTLTYQGETLGMVLADISREHHVYFSYSPNYIPVGEQVAFKVVDVPLGKALDTLFADYAIDYVNIAGQIVLTIDRDRLALLEASRQTKPMPVPLIDERMAAERGRLGSRMPDLTTAESAALPGGDGYRNVDLQKYRDVFSQVLQEEEAAVALQPVVSNHRLAQVSLLPFLGTNTYRSSEMTNNFSLNIFWGANGGVDGVEVGGFVNTVIRDMKGLQIGGLGNTVGGDVHGTQFGGLFNFNEGLTRGFQLAGVFNRTRHTDAIQLAGGFNIAVQDAKGLQLAGLFNVGAGRAGTQVATLFNSSGDTTRNQVAALFNAAADVEGIQVSLLFNKARRVGGFQLGLINTADTVSGLSLGVLTFVKKGYNRIEVAGSEVLYANLGLKLGTRGFYNILHAGVRWDALNQTAGRVQNGVFMSWGLGYGIGTALTAGQRWMVNLEAVAIHVNEMERWTKKLNLLNQLRLTVDCRSGGRASFFAGPVGNVMVSKLRDPETGVTGSVIPPYAFYDKTTGNTNVKMWVGFYGGMRF